MNSQHENESDFENELESELESELGSEFETEFESEPGSEPGSESESESGSEFVDEFQSGTAADPPSELNQKNISPPKRGRGRPSYKPKEIFDRARKLNVLIQKIRDDYNDVFDNPVRHSSRDRKLSVIIYLLDQTGYRPGVKEEGGVGIRTLRVEHITMLDENYVRLNFIGKHRVEYDKPNKVDPRVYKLLEEFLSNKTDHDLVFDKVSYVYLNNHLKNKYDGITSGVFRTYKGSSMFETEVSKLTEKWLNDHPNADPQNQFQLLKENCYDVARNKVKEKLNHIKEVSGDNYIDPRIIVAWCAKNGIPLELMNGFKRNKKNRARKEWAVTGNDNFIFTEPPSE